MIQKKSEEERRKHCRVPVLFPVRYEKIEIKKRKSLIPDSLSLEGTVLDISAGGIKLRAAGEIKKGDYLELKLPPSIIPETHHFFGHVKWVSKEVSYSRKILHTGGLCFVEINKEIHKRLLKKIRQLKKNMD